MEPPVSVAQHELAVLHLFELVVISDGEPLSVQPNAWKLSGCDTTTFEDRTKWWESAAAGKIFSAMFPSWLRRSLELRSLKETVHAIQNTRLLKNQDGPSVCRYSLFDGCAAMANNWAERPRLVEPKISRPCRYG